MSSVRYCDDTEPHEMHGWNLTARYSDGTATVDHFYCYGVKGSPAMRQAVRRLRVAERALDARRAQLATLATAHRYTEAEAMHYGPEAEA